MNLDQVARFIELHKAAIKTDRPLRRAKRLKNFGAILATISFGAPFVSAGFRVSDPVLSLVALICIPLVLLGTIMLGAFSNRETRRSDELRAAIKAAPEFTHSTYTEPERS